MDVTCMQEAHFSSLPSQSNIYGLAHLTMSNSVKKLLIASLKRRVFCVEYTRNNSNYLVPSAREVQFTYIPTSAEIVSIDAFNKPNSDHDSFVGITLIKSSDKNSTQYLNIYSDWQPGSECDLENIAQGCLTIQLDFVPYQLNHWELETNIGKEIVWLLSGSDCKIHLFREDPLMQGFREEPTTILFPEFEDLPSIVYSFEMYNLRDKRVTVVGCENGNVRVSIVLTQPGHTELIKTCHVQLDSPIASVKLFKDTQPLATPAFLEKAWNKIDEEDETQNLLHLLVASSLEKAVVYRDVLNGFDKITVLPGSDGFDCITTACVADVDMDGVNEIVLGSYGQQLLIYKWNAASESYFSLWIRSFSQPLLALSCVDFIGDGVNEMLVLSTKGLHILQYDPDTVASLCLKRMKLVLERNKYLINEDDENLDEC